MNGSAEKLRCFYTVSYNQLNSEALITGVAVGIKERVYFQYEQTVTARASHIADFMAIKLMLEKLEELKGKGEMDSDTDVVIYSGYKGVMDTVNKARNSNRSRIRVLRDIINILELNKNWVISWRRGVRKIISGILKQNKRETKKPKEFKTVRELIKDENTGIVFFDIEMNCSEALKEGARGWEIISIGAVKLNTRLELEKDGRFYSLVKPTVDSDLSEQCILLTGIRQEQVEGARSFNTVMDHFSEWVGDMGNTVFVSWGEEDVKAIARDTEVNRYSREFLEQIRANYSNFQNELSKYLASTNPMSLKNALGIFNISFQGAQHNAQDDAFNLSQLYISYVDNIIKCEMMASQ